MPITEGDISIIVPVASAEVAAGAPFRVAGRTEARLFTKPVGDIENEIPPSQVVVGFQDTPLQPARALDVDWSQWDATLQTPSVPGGLLH